MNRRVAAVVPAAGRSRRMGREKIELPWEISTILETILDKIAAVGARPVVVVLRSDLTEAQERARRRGAAVVVNPRPDEGMIESVRLGISALAEPFDAVILWPGDHPAVAAPTLEALLQAADRTRAIVPRHQGRRGHPVVIGSDLLAGIAAIPPGEGLRHLWRMRPEAVRELDVEDPGVLIDLDTPADYERSKPRGI
ncbi:MAG TPA: nucleotidyltransferase family protein [Thermoanaerobaculia bacterium]|nr:nucleotidyltransferase family protein [Thermoanaerobaculia bacterium]